MDTTQTLLQRCKSELGIESDYALAKALDMSHQAISKYQNGTRQMDNWACSQVALILGMDLSAVIAISELEREKDETKRKFWENFYRERFAKLIVAVAFMVGMLATIAPQSLQNLAENGQKEVFLASNNGDRGVGGVILAFLNHLNTLLNIISLMRIIVITQRRT